MNYVLSRTLYDPQGTFGQLIDPQGNKLCLTVELPWLNNHPQTSCIPKGNYQVKAYQSPKHGQVWQIMNVPDRSYIEIHAANTILDLLGCIGTGNALGEVEGLPAVLNSQTTLAMLRSTLPQSFSLTIQ